MKSYSKSVARCEHDFSRSISKKNIDEFISRIKSDCDDASCARLGVCNKACLLNSSILCCHKKIIILFKGFNRNACGNMFVWFKVEKIDNCFSFCLSRSFWNLIDFKPMDNPLISEEENSIKIVCNKNIFNN